MRLADLTASAPADYVRRGLAWWLGELGQMLPRRWTARAGAATVLHLGREGATLSCSRRGGRQVETIVLPEADAPAAAGDAGRAEADRTQADWARARAMLRRGRGALIVRLDPSLLLETTTTLPIAAERSLRRILQHQLDRLLPLPAEEVMFDCAVIARAPEAKTITVRLVVATRASIGRALDLARGLGTTPRRILAEVPAGPGGWNGQGGIVTFWRADRAAGSRARRRLFRLLEITAIMLLIAAYGLYLDRLGEVQADLRAQTALATKTMARARDLSRQIEQGQATLAVLDGRAREMAPLALLDELTRLLPDSAWVSQLTVRGPDVEIVGYADRVSQLIQLIEQHDGFGNAHLRAPITPSPDGKGERFDVGFTVGARGPS